MKTALVGYTGFVGSNLAAHYNFDGLYNSTNIGEAYHTNPELLIYSGIRAEKFLANADPGKDLASMQEAMDNIHRINAQKLVLISTIDVFKFPKEVDENSMIETEGLHAYGYNRYQLELGVREMYPDALIIRLPGLFGKKIKKNFIYDFINVIPFMLKKEKMAELTQADSELISYYTLQDNGFYRLNLLTDNERTILKYKFGQVGFSALNFTDSRSIFQFYDLSRLWNDIKQALNAGIQLWHPATEPVTAEELYQSLTGKKFVNKLDGTPVEYNYKTIHAKMFGGSGGYICDKITVMDQIRTFVRQEK